MSKVFGDAIRFFQAEDCTAAKEACGRALQEDGDSCNAHHLMGVLFAKENDHESAVKHLERAVALNPVLTEALFNLGKAFRDLGRVEKATHTFQEVARLWPTRANVWIELGLSYDQQGQLTEAAAAYETAVEFGGEKPELLSQLARAHMRNGNLELAETCLNKAVTLDPSYIPAKINAAILRENQGQLNEALALYDEVLRMAPDNDDALIRRALGLLTLPDLPKGWHAYAPRGAWKSSTTSHGESEAPYWSGEDLSDKTILVWTEQGPGDEILTASMIPEMEHLARKTVLACSSRLKPIFERSFPWCDVIAREGLQIPGKTLGEIDVQASLTELGAIFRASLDDFPKNKSFLKADQDQSETLQRRYSQGDTSRPLVGISWRSANIDTSIEKSTGLRTWCDILSNGDCRFVSLQYGDCVQEIASVEQEFGVSIMRDTTVDPVVDMESFAAQVSAMDLVISTTNTTVHVAGALGTPVWTLVPEGTGRPWYWFLERSDSPWYPTMRLYRQSSAKDWSIPLTMVHHDLSQWIQNWSPIRH